MATQTPLPDILYHRPPHHLVPVHRTIMFARALAIFLLLATCASAEMGSGLLG